MSDYTYSRTDEVLLEVNGVGLSFNGRTILRDVNATITDVDRTDQIQGQVVAFLGPSGIGKTQLSRVIAGLQKPTCGEVLLRGKPTQPGEVCMVPQNYPMFEYTTVWGNLKIAGQMAGLSSEAIKIKADGYVDTFGLRDYLKMYPGQLSGGTRQRVAIARQMMCASHYMVMDEPFSGLDPIMKKQATLAITQLAQLDTYNTIIIVTHDISEGLSVADTVWLMGYEKNERGSCIPGAKLIEEIDLASLGFAWRPDLEGDPQFRLLVREVREKFKELK